MAATLQTILSEIKKNGKELVGIKSRLMSLEKKVSGLEKDMKKPSGGSRPVISIAAKSH
jgi:hypothetical protein